VRVRRKAVEKVQPQQVKTTLSSIWKEEKRETPALETGEPLLLFRLPTNPGSPTGRRDGESRPITTLLSPRLPIPLSLSLSLHHMDYKERRSREGIK